MKCLAKLTTKVLNKYLTVVPFAPPNSTMSSTTFPLAKSLRTIRTLISMGTWPITSPSFLIFESKMFTFVTSGTNQSRKKGAGTRKRLLNSFPSVVLMSLTFSSFNIFPQLVFHHCSVVIDFVRFLFLLPFWKSLNSSDKSIKSSEFSLIKEFPIFSWRSDIALLPCKSCERNFSLLIVVSSRNSAKFPKTYENGF